MLIWQVPLPLYITQHNCTVGWNLEKDAILRIPCIQSFYFLKIFTQHRPKHTIYIESFFNFETYCEFGTDNRMESSSTGNRKIVDFLAKIILLFHKQNIFFLENCRLPLNNNKKKTIRKHPMQYISISLLSFEPKN